MGHNYFMQSVPDSHYWTGLKGIINIVEYELKYHATKYDREKRIKLSEHTIVNMYKTLTTEHLVIGLKNCIKNKYKLKSITKNSIKVVLEHKQVFTTIEQMIIFIQSNDYTHKAFLKLLKNTRKNEIDLKCERKMERYDVYKCIDTERDYQDLRWSPRREKNDTPDESKPPAEWINYIEHHLVLAKQQVYFLNDELALTEIRKIAALAVRCIEIHGCPERVIPADLLTKNDEEKQQD